MDTYIKNFIMYNSDYLKLISNKLDALNKASGSNIEPNKNLKSIDNYSGDILGQIGMASANYLKFRNSDTGNFNIDPLFTNHNN
jgi:hypothetical protein